MVANLALDPVSASTTYALNQKRGITNIGSHPDNDIVLQQPGVAPFHLMIDHRQKPYRVIALSPEADLYIRGIRMGGNEPREVEDLNLVQFAGLALRSQEGPNGTPVTSISLVKSGNEPPKGGSPSNGHESPQPEEEEAPAPKRSQAAAKSSLTEGLTRTDEYIILSLADSTLAVDVGDTVIFRLTINNGGGYVALFDVFLEGLPDGKWYEIEPPRVKLYEGGRGVVEIRVTPPDSAESLAKMYPLRIVVKSRTYENLYSDITAELTVNPFYKFQVLGLLPSNQSVSYTRKSGKTTMPLTNLGNSRASYLVSAQDEENGCQFSFPLEGKASLIKQAEITVEPGAKVDVPIVITPLKPHVVRLQSHKYQYTVTTQSMSGQAMTNMVAGSFTARPLFGLFHILLSIIILLLTAYLVFTPEVRAFGPENRIIRQGDLANLKWSVTPFTTNLRILEISEPILSNQRQISLVPATTFSTYTLEGSNWLSNLLRQVPPSLKTSVLAIPNYPEISTLFIGQQDDIFAGDNVIIKWDTRNAEEVTLTVEGVTTPLKPDEFSGERTVKISGSTLVILEARNISGKITRSEYIQAKKSEVTTMVFNIDKPVVIKGEPVTLTWRVEGTGIESVSISPFEENMPLVSDPSEPLQFYPDSSMEFILSVKMRDGTIKGPVLRSVGVLPAAEPPEVTIFEAAPKELTATGNVELTWSVTGKYDSLILTSSKGLRKQITKSEGFENITVSDTTSFMLTATYAGLSHSLNQVVVVNKPKPVRVTITEINPISGASVGETANVFVTVLPLDKNGVPASPESLGLDPVTGKITVSDGGTSTCDIELPTGKSCALTLMKAGDYDLQANYMGDKNYAPATSALRKISVKGNPVAISLKFTNASLPLKVGQLAAIEVTVTDAQNPSDPAYPLSGKIIIYDPSNTSSPELCRSASPTNTLTCNISFPSRGNKILEVSFTESLYYSLSSPTIAFSSALDITPSGTPPVAETILVDPAPVKLTFSDIPLNTTVGRSHTIRVSAQVEYTDARVFDSTRNVKPDGTVVLRDKNYITDSCTFTLVNGVDDCSFLFSKSSTLGNPRTLEASYSSGVNGNFVDIPFYDLVFQKVNVAAAATKTEIVSMTPASAEFNQTVTVTARTTVLNTNPAVAVKQGKIKITVSALGVLKSQCEPTVNALGEVTCDLQVPQAGLIVFKASYSDTASPVDYNISDSGDINYTAAKVATTIVDYPTTVASTGVNDPLTINFKVRSVNQSTLPPEGTAFLQAGAPGFETGATCNGTVNGSDLEFSCSITLTAQGDNRTITIRFNGSDNFAPSAQDINHSVLRAVNMSITATPSFTIFGQEVVFRCSVTDPTAFGTPTGLCTVTATEKNAPDPANPATQTCVVNNVSLATNTCTINFNKAATYTISASYAGDSRFGGKTVSGSDVVVSKAQTFVSNIQSSNYAPARNEPFFVTFQVLNISTAVTPEGTARVDLISPTADPLWAPSCDPNNPQGTQTTLVGAGTGSVRFTRGKGTYYMVVYYEGVTSPDNFSRSCNFSTTPIVVP